MANERFAGVKYLAFDIFGTVMDLTGSLTGPVGDFLAAQGSKMSGEAFYADWRDRQRIEQYQDNLLMLGHSGYLETCRRAFVYCLRKHNVSYTDEAVREFMEAYKRLQPFDDAIQGLRALGQRYKLVALSNGEQWYLEELLHNNVPLTFDAIISVDQVGAFKPSPGIYRKAVQRLGCEPGEIMMVAAHSFDILGAQACGFRAAYVDRYGLPTEVSEYQPDIIVDDFVELATRLLK
ncbi:MAG: haloacid dehalogenase type II [Dehalococcoidia bacterium]|nr:haloacid dehalogenase type II [Dehalococcoidia bacterium]